MAQGKKSFILCSDIQELVSRLPDDVAGRLFKAVFSFVNGIEPIIEESFKSSYLLITEQIKNEWFKYNPKNDKYHWNYQGGISKKNHSIRNSNKTKFWRENVFKRDNYICQNCKKVSGILNAHHIKSFAKFPELRFDITNGITLCKKCHIDEHKKLKNER